MAYRNRLQHYGIEEAEDGGARADAERECENGDGSEPGRFEQRTNAKAYIPPECFNKRLPAARTDDFLANVETAPLQAHGAKRFLTPYALLHLFRRFHLQVAAQLLVQFPVHLLLAKQRSKPVR